MKAIGLDIGTSNISGVVVDLETFDTLVTISKQNDTSLPGTHTWERLQDPDKTAGICISILDELYNDFSDITSLGISGQMHGILYVGGGKAKSSLITWQDERGNLMSADGMTCAQKLSKATATPAASGYGLVTLLYDAKNGSIPPDAEGICTIGDYIGMVLCGNKTPLLHVSNAASLGGYDLESGCFSENLPCEINRNLLPEVLNGEKIIGNYRGTPVCCAIGDNQSSVFGSLGNGSSVLVNIGTGGQISAVSDSPVKYGNCGLECRPYIGGKYLSVGAVLCGGYAYTVLYDFFRKTAKMLGTAEPDELYKIMDAYAEQALDNKSKLTVDTRFQGTRDEPTLRGGITDIDTDNFTPGALCLGVLEGICNELWELSGNIRPPISKANPLTASGGGIRNSKLMQNLLRKTFECEIIIPSNHEEAAHGAALISYTFTKLPCLCDR